MQSLSESAALKIIRRELGDGFISSPRGKVRLSIGDDCAVLSPSSKVAVWTMDACNEGSHFLWEWMEPEHVARKSFHAALSDIPAMGGRPTAALCQLTLGPTVDAHWLRRFTRAQAEVARLTKTPLIGGNVSFGDLLQVVTTVLGSVSKKPLRRDGARAGDEIWVVGSLGLARAGLLLLKRGGERFVASAGAVEKCLSAFRQPQAQWKEGPRLVGRANACMDVSDGLSRDLSTLARSSSLRALVDLPLLEKSLAKELSLIAPLVEETALSLAIEGGEDYALLATGPGAKRPRFAQAIGVMQKGSGTYLRTAGGVSRLGDGATRKRALPHK